MSVENKLAAKLAALRLNFPGPSHFEIPMAAMHSANLTLRHFPVRNLSLTAITVMNGLLT